MRAGKQLYHDMAMRAYVKGLRDFPEFDEAPEWFKQLMELSAEVHAPVVARQVSYSGRVTDWVRSRVLHR